MTQGRPDKLMRLKIAVLAGDGIGPEVTSIAVDILGCVADMSGHELQVVDGLIGGAAIRAHNTPLPPQTLELAMGSDAVLLGAVGASEFNSLAADQRPEAGLLQLRRALGGYANLRPAFAWRSTAQASPLKAEIIEGVDLLFVRELLGGLYFSAPRGYDPQSLSAVNTMRYSEQEIERVARVAFELAMNRRKKVTSVDKANVLEVSQLWRDVVTRVAKDYPQVTLEHQLVDSCAMLLMKSPRQFDVVLTENLFGDILTDEAGVIAGSLGMLPSATIGGSVNLYEPVHGSAPDIAGTGKANPIGAILTAAMLLRYTAGMADDADAIALSVQRVLEQGHRTADLMSSSEPGLRLVSTCEMGKLITHELNSILDSRHSLHAV